MMTMDDVNGVFVAQNANILLERTRKARIEHEKEFSISIRGVSQSYPSRHGGPDTRVVDNISLELVGPSINMLLGASGTGKSTVLRMLGGMRPEGVKTPTSGTIYINGVRSDDEHPDVVMVFQKTMVRLDMTVRENITFPFRMKLWNNKVSKDDQRSRTDEILKAVGLWDKQHLNPSQLSGGQNQRVALARALVLRPRVLLMDEPFGALDAQTRAEMQRLLIKIWMANKCQIIFVTHDVDEALLLGDRIIVLSKPPANIALDFEISNDERQRSAEWLYSPNTSALKKRIIDVLNS